MPFALPQAFALRNCVIPNIPNSRKVAFDLRVYHRECHGETWPMNNPDQLRRIRSPSRQPCAILTTPYHTSFEALKAKQTEAQYTSTRLAILFRPSPDRALLHYLYHRIASRLACPVDV